MAISTHENSTTNQETHDDNVTSQELLISMSQWNETPDWRHLVQLNMTFLKFAQTPGLEEMLKIPYTADFKEKHLIPRLLDLHEYGLFGISGQAKQAPVSIEQFPDSETWEERKQAQYLEFFIPHGEAGKKFIEFLLTDSQLQGVGFDWEGTKLTGGSENEIEVAWYRESNSQETLKDAIWKSEAVIPATYDRNYYEDLDKIEAFCKENPIFCAITTLKNEVDLLDRIEMHAKTAGIKMDNELEA